MQKEMNEMNFVHMFNVYSTVVCRFARSGSHLDATDVIAYDNGYNEHNDNPLQKDLKMSYKYLDIYKSH